MKALLAALLLLSACAGRPSGDQAVLELRIADRNPCVSEHDGRAYGIEQLEAFARSWPARPRRARLILGSDTPYRCIGGAIYALQRAGFRHIDTDIGDVTAEQP